MLEVCKHTSNDYAQIPICAPIRYTTALRRKFLINFCWKRFGLAEGGKRSPAALAMATVLLGTDCKMPRDPTAANANFCRSEWRGTGHALKCAEA
jgi:hypothetical protein